jgi:hypothetical protein
MALLKINELPLSDIHSEWVARVVFIWFADVLGMMAKEGPISKLITYKCG